jgi:hypothetical protein
VANGIRTEARRGANVSHDVLVIVERKPGVTTPFAELVEDPAGDSQITTVLGVAAPPGVPGTSAVQTQGTGPPHFTPGMQRVLTVTA